MIHTSSSIHIYLHTFLLEYLVLIYSAPNIVVFYTNVRTIQGAEELNVYLFWLLIFLFVNFLFGLYKFHSFGSILITRPITSTCFSKCWMCGKCTNLHQHLTKKIKIYSQKYFQFRFVWTSATSSFNLLLAENKLYDEFNVSLRKL